MLFMMGTWLCEGHVPVMREASVIRHAFVRVT